MTVRDGVAAGILDATPTPLAAIRFDTGEFVFANSACRLALGLEPDDPIDSITPDQFWLDDGGGLAEIRERLIADPSIGEIELWFRHPTKGDRRLLAAVRVADLDGVRCTVNSFVDVTDWSRRRHEIAERLHTAAILRESDARFRQLADSLDEVFILWTLRDNELLYISPAVTKVMGLPVEGLDLPSLFAITHPDDQLVLRESLTGQLTAGPPTVVDYRIIRPDGEIRWIRSRTAVVEQNVDHRVRRSTTLLDITEQRRAEDLAAAARAEAEQANRAKSDFLSRMSHELRTPLNAVLGFAQLVKSETSSDLRGDYVDQIIKAGGHLLGLIDEVLDIARIESGFLRMSIEPVEVEDVVHDAVTLVTPSARAAGLAIRVDVRADAAVFVRADRQRLKQVLLNLLSNAVKYNVRGGTIEVSASRLSNGMVQLMVADSGPGISDEDIAKLFLPFERLGAESSGVPGTGLGLALAQQLAEMMGGALLMESELGHGSRFWIELPVTAPAPAPIAPGSPRDRHLGGGPSATPPRPVPLSVLLVEDNVSNVQLVRGILRHRPSVALVTATDGRTALEVVGSERLDLILLDNHLPDTTGVEVLRWIKADPRIAHIPVVLVSADATAGQIDAAMNAGATSYLTKPIDVSQFIAVIDRVASAARPTVLYVEDDELNGVVMSRVFGTHLPGAALELAVDGASALAAVARLAPQLVIIDRGLPDMSGLRVVAALQADAVTASIPVLVLSGDPPPANWISGPAMAYLMKPYEISHLVRVVRQLLGID